MFPTLHTSIMLVYIYSISTNKPFPNSLIDSILTYVSLRKVIKIQVGAQAIASAVCFETRVLWALDQSH